MQKGNITAELFQYLKVLCPKISTLYLSQFQRY